MPAYLNLHIVAHDYRISFATCIFLYIHQVDKIGFMNAEENGIRQQPVVIKQWFGNYEGFIVGETEDGITAFCLSTNDFFQNYKA